MKLYENHSLQAVSTFHVKATAKYYAEFTSADELKDILSIPNVKANPLIILGGGSNLLFLNNYSGTVIRNAIQGISLIKQEGDAVFVKAHAGEMWHNVVLYCVGRNYGGIENLSLIPGTTGAAPIQNIGAYGVELKDVLCEVEALHIKTLQLKKFTLAECKFGYRDSIFKNTEKGNYAILSVTLKLNANSERVNISYGALSAELEHSGIKNPTIKDVSNAVIKIRSGKLPDPQKIGNAGSFFKNPVVPEEHFKKVKALYPAIVSFPAQQGHVKLAAGWLIEQCGWKGKRFGDAGVHQHQALVLVNYANATGKEIYDLSEKIIQSVKQKFNVELEREVNIL